MALQPNWTKQEDDILRQHYGLITSKRIFENGLLPNRTLTGIRSRAKTLEIRSRIRHTTHSFNDAFWKEPNHINAYWAGEMASDGCLMKLNGKNETFVLQLTISVRDIEHLRVFKEAIGYTGSIKTYESKCPISTRDPTVTHTMCYVRLCQMRKCEKELRELWGIVPHKTFTIAPPALTDNVLKLCYIAGYLDGDGTISADYAKGLPYVGFTSCSVKILQWFQEVFDDLFQCTLRGKPTALAHPSSEEEINTCWSYSISGFRAMKIMDIMSRLPVPKMDRKWKNPRILAIMEDYKRRYPVEWSVRLPIEDEIVAFLLKVAPPPISP